MKKIVLSFIALVVVVSLLLGACAKPAPAPAQEKERNLKVEFFSPNAVGVQPETGKFMWDYITQQTGGKIKFEVFYGVLGSINDAFALVGAGAVDIGRVQSQQTVSENPYFATMELPGSSTNHWAIARAALDMMSEARIDAEMEHHKVVALTGEGPGSMMIAARGKITKGKLFDAFNGMKVRSPTASWGELFKEMGIVPVTMSGSEAYQALERGVIDGALSGVRTVFLSKWYEAAKSLILLRTEIAAGTYAINRDLWNSFSPATRDIFKKAGELYTDELMRRTIQEEVGYLEQLETKYGMQVYRPTPEEQAKLNATAARARQSWFDQWDAKGYKTEKWYSDFQALIKKYEQEFAQKGYPWQR